MTLHKVTVSFECTVECEDPKHIPLIVQDHAPFINGCGNAHGKYEIKSVMRSAKVSNIK